MGYYSTTKDYIKLLTKLSLKTDDCRRDELYRDVEDPKQIIYWLTGYVQPIYQSELADRYSEPVPFIGLYIALASSYCILAMMADVLHGLRSRKLWFPCKYFTINAFSLIVIGIAMKLPVDLTGSMPGDVDQVAKLGSMAFMCTMMANLLPCLATMDSNALLTNIAALGVMVITLVVNVCIQIKTGVISYNEDARLLNTVANKYKLESLGVNKDRNVIIATIYATLLMVLLIIYACSSLMILKSKEMIESKYQQRHEKASKVVQQSGATGKILAVEELEQHVRNYFLMAGSGSPQFIIACFETTTASGVICALTTIMHTLTLCWSISAMLSTDDYGSDYRFSMPLILVVQFIGVLLGTIAPLSRCFATLSFKVSRIIISNRMKVFKVESYWTQKLYEWKQGTLRFPFRGHHQLKMVINTLKDEIFNFCIKFQVGVVVVCKILALIPFFFMICVFYFLKQLLQVTVSSSREKTENVDPHYVLQLDEMELADRTLEGLSKSLNRLILKGQRKQPDDLKKFLLEKATTDFQGVKNSDASHYVPSLLPKVEYQDCWSLLVVTLTTIAISLKNIEKDDVNRLLKSVREGLEYVTLVEERLNTTDDYASAQKAAATLWKEVDTHHEWLEEKLQDFSKSQVDSAANQEDNAQKIVSLFLKKAKNKINEGVRSKDGGGPTGNSKYTSICACSMYRITKTRLDVKKSNKELFNELSKMIADIMVACLINLPQVIAMNCHTSVIEKREACVQATAQLLGETKQLISTLQDREIPRINPDDLPFLDKWRAYLSDP